VTVSKLDIIDQHPLLDGKPFGTTGPYDVIKGTIHFAVDPHQPSNADICDLALAPQTGRGVEWQADFCILQPADAARGNRRLLFEVVNRGRIRAFRMFDGVDGTPDLAHPEHIGDGFLLQQGYTVAWCGWQWDVIRRDGLFSLDVPEAMLDGAPVRGKVACNWVPNEPSEVLLLADRVHHPYPVLDVSTADAVLTVRDYEEAPRQVIPRHQWQFARLENGAVIPDSTHIYLPTGFQAGKLYDCVYPTQKAPVVGLGLLAVRDAVSFWRYEADSQRNPCANQIDYAYAFGISQSGRFLRHYLYVNLNQDEHRRQVFDAVIPHIAGGRRGEFNHRFAQPSANTMRCPNNVFPFTDAEQIDPLSGQSDGLLHRMSEAGTLPKIFHINSSAEYWRGDASLSHISLDGSEDVELPNTVRNYLFAGTQHTPGPFPLQDTAENGTRCQHPLNCVDYSPLLRAALDNLDAWVVDQRTPPPSQYPKRCDSSAVVPQQLAPLFKAFPGASFPAHLPQPRRLDFGPQWPPQISLLPPHEGNFYPIFVPAVDHDGNEIAGIRLPDLTVPLATYTGWNLRHPTQGAADQLVRMHGSTLPFAVTLRERLDNGDPRLSIEERYPSRAIYLQQVKKAAEGLIAGRYLRAADLDRVLQAAAERYDLLTQTT
jgi:hypothetical protein